MQTLGRVLLSQLRPHALSSSQVAPAAAAAAVTQAGWLSSIRFFSSEGVQRLYVGNLSYDIDQADVQQAFEKFGTVHDCNLPRRKDGKHKGFGFVELDAAAAEAAINALNEQELLGRRVQVKIAEPKIDRGDRPQRAQVFVRPGFKRLYVGNLNFRTTAADLGRHFQQFGAVQDCVIPLDAAGRSRGYGFVELDDQGAASAVKELNGATFDGRQLIVRDQQPN